MSNQLVEVFLGETIEDRGEKHVLGRLRADLEQRGVEAWIFANFVAGKQQRQIDLLVLTPTRLTHVELKNLDPQLPIVAGVNGHWRQVLPDSSERSLGRNFHRQAHEATYAISDAMRALASTGTVPRAAREFFRDIDTVICVYPSVPTGSVLEPYRHVDVVGYDELVERLLSDGPRPEWSAGDWAAFARHLGVFAPPTDSPAERNRLAKLAQVRDYQRRFIAQAAAGLHELVPVPALLDGQQVESALGALMKAARSNALICATGVSGAGKSHVARHAAVELARQGGIPIWVRCREYEPGRFSVALARATAAFSTTPAGQLVQQATETSGPVVVFLDGLNECPPDARGELLEQLSALRLRYPVGAVITSSEFVELAFGTEFSQVSLMLPDAEARAALLESYGAPSLPVIDTLATPFELALAAECAGDLPPGATRTDVLDAYVRRRCPRENVRAALRHLATSMDERLRLALPLAEALTAVRAMSAQAPDVVDEVLASPLLIVGQGRVAFAHERIGRFLAAEHHVLTIPDSTLLAEALQDPHRRDLGEFALGMREDGPNRADLLIALANPGLLAEAARGHLGPATAQHARYRISTAVQEAKDDLADATLSVSPPDATFGAWIQVTPRSNVGQALLVAAGLCLADNLFIPEVATLLDATDERCAREIRVLREAGSRIPISTIVATTYSGIYSGGTDVLRELGASIVVRTCGNDRMMRHDPRTEAATATGVLTATDLRPRWGRLFLAIHLVNTSNETDVRGLPELVEDAWSAGGYHLQLEALDSLRWFARDADEDLRARILAVLRTLDPKDNLGLSTTLVDVLSAYGDIEPMTTLEEINDHVAALLAAPDNPEVWAAAQHVIASQFDNTAVLGPYDEAIAGLSEQAKLRLYMLASQGSDTPFHIDWIISQIAELAAPSDDAAVEVLRRQVSHVDMDSPMPQEPVSAHVAALLWWAKFQPELPSAELPDGDLMRHAWRIIDRLVFMLLREQPGPGVAHHLWSDAQALCPGETIGVLSHLRSVFSWRFRNNDENPFALLLRAHPDQVRRLAEWTLTHPDALPPFNITRRGPDELERVAHEILCHVGDAESANLLRGLSDDGSRRDAAVDTVREIERRLNTPD